MVVGKTYRGRLRRFTFTAPGGRDLIQTKRYAVQFLGW